MVLEICWTVGYLMVPTFAYFVRDWRKLQAAYVAPYVLLIFYYWLLDESPRWLYYRSRTEEGDAVVRKMAKFNRKSLPGNFKVKIQEDNKTGYVWDLFRTRNMRLRAIAVFVAWFVISMVFYGLSLNMKALSGNPYINVFLMGLVELPAYLSTMYVVSRLGRRKPFCCSLLVAGITLLLTLAFLDRPTWLLVLLLTVKFCISASFAMVFLITAEVFPTAVRNVAVSSGSFWARMGGIVAPFIGQLSDYSLIIPIAIFGLCSLVAGLLSLCLPETKDVLLPETLADGETFTVTVKSNQTPAPKEKSEDALLESPDTADVEKKAEQEL